MRSGSQTDILLAEIKSLKSTIESSKQEVIQTLKKDIDCLNDAIKLLTTRVVDLERQNEELKVKCELLSNPPVVPTEAIIEECEQRRRRECNAFVIGIPEVASDCVDKAEDHDREKIEKMLLTIESPDVHVKELRRVGRVTPGSSGKRPLLLTFSSANQKWKVLKNASKLRKYSQFSSVYINADRTPLQQAQHRDLLSELRVRRNNGEDVVLFRNKIMERGEIKTLIMSKNVHPSASVFGR